MILVHAEVAKNIKNVVESKKKLIIKGGIKVKILYAPEVDSLLRILEIKSFNAEGCDEEVQKKINELYGLLDKIKPIEGGDDLKILYFSVDKGTIESYGDYEDAKSWGEVDNYEQFEKNYQDDYPDEVYWYRLVTSKYQSYRTISVNFKTIVCADLNENGYDFKSNQLQELLDFLIYKVRKCIEMLENNTYNDYIAKNLSYNKRFGVIKRSDYWVLYPDIKSNLLSEISEEEIDEFVKMASDQTNDRIKDMTAGKYYEAVRLSYQNNNYDIGDLSDKELYLKYSDGRDEGLRDINDDSMIEFNDWYQDKNRFGGHPWEIMRGHSFSRVNLIVYHDDNGYYLGLNGNIILRKVEIAKIYLALKKNSIPIEIYNVDVIKNALIGNDYIGIVPNEIFPISCGSYFKEHKPLEFINFDKNIINHVIWQDVEKVFLK